MPSESLVPAIRVAERFGVRVETVNAWVRTRRISCVRVTRKTVRFSLSEVEKALRCAERPQDASDGRRVS